MTITTPFGFHSTTDDVLGKNESSDGSDGIDLTGKRIVVTGGASGIGLETSRALAAAGAHVTAAVRRTDGAVAAFDALAPDPALRSRIDIAPLDLADPSSIAAFASSWRGPLDVLVNNAGVMAPPLERIWGGHEIQFATNHLGHMALTLGLLPFLEEGAGSQGSGRVVMVSSSAHQLCPVLFDDVDFRFVPYDPYLSYGQSKTANVLFAVEASHLWASRGVTVNALNPGAVATNLQRHVGGSPITPPERRKTVAEGAATSVFLAASPLVEGVGGRYFENASEAAALTRREEGSAGVAPFALDAANASRLWEVSLALLAGSAGA
ncbi:MAG: oxidoreductase [Frondihabitans sp.]|nr:oxidoreductase [Frondihabitans sp.]